MPGGRHRKEEPPRSAGSPSFRNRRSSFGVRPARTPLQPSTNDRKSALTSSTPDLSLRHHRREQGLMLALASPALLVILLGYPIAYAASAVPKGWSVLILALVILPFWTSVLVRAYAWLALLQRTGVINQFLQYFGVIEEPLALVHNTFGTVVATVHILLPFMVLPLYATMQQIPRDLMQAGASLGAGPMLTFWRIFLPLSLPGVLAGSTLVFVLSLGFYITPELLGGGRT